MKADFVLGNGGIHQQLIDAAVYYNEVKIANPNATISFTGHSLGGGLAALMGVFFDKKALTFDPAPFKMAARNNWNGILDRFRQANVSEETLEPMIAYAASNAALYTTREGVVSVKKTDEWNQQVTTQQTNLVSNKRS